MSVPQTPSRFQAEIGTGPLASELWRDPVRGAAAYPGLAALPGIDQLRRLASGAVPAPPVSHLTGRRIVCATPGSVTYALPATAWTLGPRLAIASAEVMDGVERVAIATGTTALAPGA